MLCALSNTNKEKALPSDKRSAHEGTPSSIPSSTLNLTLRGRTWPSGPSGMCFFRTGGCRLPRDAFLGVRGMGCMTRGCRTGLGSGSRGATGAGGGPGSRPRMDEMRDVVRWRRVPAKRPRVAAVASWGVLVGGYFRHRGPFPSAWRQDMQGLELPGTYKGIKRLLDNQSFHPINRDPA